ncbi:MAG: thermonuclease family protein [Candidatus Omnitrophica bacterium]|nr:thermonuclease family protein [Candidatus Omnitrophota bacterium]MCK4423313.1 thermonuclease family protein [Candidatus Omnitrophota bacterium]
MARKEKVTRIIDGDTFKTSSRKNPVRLANVDTPEKKQKGYGQAKQALAGMIQDETVLIDTKARDKYGRAVAIVKLGNKSVNNAMKKYKK